jgi:hypothetical protein
MTVIAPAAEALSKVSSSSASASASSSYLGTPSAPYYPPSPLLQSLLSQPRQTKAIEWARVDDAALRIETILSGQAAPLHSVDDPCGLVFTRSERVQPIASPFLLPLSSSSSYPSTIHTEAALSTPAITPVPHTVVVVRCIAHGAEGGRGKLQKIARHREENRSQRIWRLCSFSSPADEGGGCCCANFIHRGCSNCFSAEADDGACAAKARGENSNPLILC